MFLLPEPSRAESPNNAAPIVRNYNIPANSLQDALRQFSLQAGIKLAFDSALLQGRATLGLSGQFEVKQALDQLLVGSGLQINFDGMCQQRCCNDKNY